jgi:probable nitrogen fixation protein
MSPVLTLTKTPPKRQKNKIQQSFLAELIKQIRLVDTLGKYYSYSDELLVDQLIISAKKDLFFTTNLNLDPFNQLLTNAFYQAIGASIEARTGQPTETYVHIRNKEFSSAVISCNGVLVLYSLIWGYRSFGFLSIAELIESAETYIRDAVIKASRYLDF